VGSKISVTVTKNWADLVYGDARRKPQKSVRASGCSGTRRSDVHVHVARKKFKRRARPTPTGLRCMPYLTVLYTPFCCV
jgi:hypothetical protein